MRAFLVGLFALAAMAMGAAPAQAQNRFYLVNNSGQTISEAYVSPSRIEEWGPDILGSGVLPPGNQVWVTPNFGDCLLDVRVRFANGTESRRMQVNACNISRIAFGGGGGGGYVGGGGPGASIGEAPAGNPSFVFVNGTGVTIREVYISLSSDRNWGADRLGANVLEPGQSMQIGLPIGRGCNTDIRVVFMSGQPVERRGIETCSRQQVVWR
ncbi:MAG TPA: Tat pathway signal protein [Roseomonas sp.]